MNQVTKAPLKEFAQFVQDNEAIYIGENGLGQKMPFLPMSVLRDYWKANHYKRIAHVLNMFDPPLIVEARSICDNFLKFFSILVYCDKVDFLSDFTRYNHDDESLPFVDAPSQWPKTPIYVQLFDVFKREQWRFCPLQFGPFAMHDRHLPDLQILPITARQDLSVSDFASATKITVHPSCNHFKDAKGNPISNDFVLKTYKTQRARDLYTNEINAFIALQNTDAKSQDIIAFFGSFVQSQNCCILLEYADRGNLAEYFEQTPSPPTGEDLLKFWESLFNVTRGLYRIHQLNPPEDRNSPGLLGSHQDIKPDNILVFSGNTDSVYDCHFKIADFGLSYIRRVLGNGRDSLFIDNKGSQMYSAPECIVNYKFLEKGQLHVDSDIDIWSLGCIFSDAAVWSVSGQPGLQEYHTLRLAETDRYKHIKGTGFDACFHNGIRRLEAVAQMHERIRDRRRVFDAITPGVTKLLLTDMLLEPQQGRLNAKQINQRVQLCLGIAKDPTKTSKYVIMDENQPRKSQPSRQLSHDGGKNSPTSPTNFDLTETEMSLMQPTILNVSPSSTIPITPRQEGVSNPVSPPLSPTSGPHGRNPSNQPTFPGSRNKDVMIHGTESAMQNGVHTSKSTALSPPRLAVNHTPPATPKRKRITAPMVREYRLARKGQGTRPVDPRVAATCTDLINKLKGRDQFFLIDDSVSMATYRPEVEDTFQAVSWLGKKIDNNNVELCLASQPNKIYRERRTSRLLEIIRRNSPSPGSCMIENALGLVADRIIEKLPGKSTLSRWLRRQSPIAVYVLTDGTWGKGAPPAGGADRPITRLVQELKSRNLNKTQVMIQFIRFGQDEEGKTCLRYLDSFGKKQLDYDIVDTRYYLDDIRQMFIGSIDEEVDREEEEEEFVPKI